MGVLAPHLTGRLLDQALTAATAIRKNDKRAQALEALADAAADILAHGPEPDARCSWIGSAVAASRSYGRG